LVGTDPESVALFLVPAGSTLTLAPPQRLGFVREVDILNEQCEETAFLLIGGGVKHWSDLPSLLIDSDGTLGIGGIITKAADRAMETTMCRASTKPE
jgi:hypothetical protein